MSHDAMRLSLCNFFYLHKVLYLDYLMKIRIGLRPVPAVSGCTVESIDTGTLRISKNLLNVLLRDFGSVVFLAPVGGSQCA